LAFLVIFTHHEASLDTRIPVALFLPNLEMGGAEKLVLDLLQEYLADDGFLFHLVLLGRGGKLAKRAEELRARGDFRFHELGLPVRYGLTAARRLNRYLIDENIRLVHSHLYDCDKTCFILKFLNPGVRVISTKHCTMVHRFPTAAINFISQYLFERIVFIDAMQQDHYRRNSGIYRKTSLIENGIPLTESERSPRRDGRLKIVCVGSFRPEKGQDILVEALNALGRQGFDFSCDFFGDGPLVETLRARVDAGLDVRFNAGRPGITAQLDAYDVIVIPSRREAFPLVLLESFAARIPVISSDYPVLAGRVGGGERAVLFKSGNAPDLAEKIRGFDRNGSLQARMVKAAREYVMQYSIRDTASKYLRLYRDSARVGAARRPPAGPT
jgi:glycosyltransferase involved in cell wall biosynthesis